jgi:hypothetical protein
MDGKFMCVATVFIRLDWLFFRFNSEILLFDVQCNLIWPAIGTKLSDASQR